MKTCWEYCPAVGEERTPFSVLQFLLTVSLTSNNVRCSTVSSSLSQLHTTVYFQCLVQTNRTFRNYEVSNAWIRKSLLWAVFKYFVSLVSGHTVQMHNLNIYTFVFVCLLKQHCYGLLCADALNWIYNYLWVNYSKTSPCTGHFGYTHRCCSLACN